jgi:hypothetical protein
MDIIIHFNNENVIIGEFVTETTMVVTVKEPVCMRYDFSAIIPQLMFVRFSNMLNDNTISFYKTAIATFNILSDKASELYAHARNFAYSDDNKKIIELETDMYIERYKELEKQLEDEKKAANVVATVANLSNSFSFSEEEIDKMLDMANTNIKN